MYRLRITDEPKRYQYFHYATLEEILYKNGEIIQGDQTAVRDAGKPRLDQDIQNLEKFVIETHFQKRSSEPFPNFLQVRFALVCADNEALKFLKSNNISYIAVPAEVANRTDRAYSVIFFEAKQDLLELKESNLYINDEGFANTVNRSAYFPGESKLVLKGKALQFKGVYRLAELSFLICDEKTKKAFEGSGLTGFSFERIEVSGN